MEHYWCGRPWVWWALADEFLQERHLCLVLPWSRHKLLALASRSGSKPNHRAILLGLRLQKAVYQGIFKVLLKTDLGNLALGASADPLGRRKRDSDSAVLSYRIMLRPWKVWHFSKGRREAGTFLDHIIAWWDSISSVFKSKPTPSEAQSLAVELQADPFATQHFDALQNNPHNKSKTIAEHAGRKSREESGRRQGYRFVERAIWFQKQKTGVSVTQRMRIYANFVTFTHRILIKFK